MSAAFAPADLAAWAHGVWTTLPPLPITGFGTDTRTLQRGEVFVALQTARRDGHAFLAEARSRGAAGALVAQPVADPLPQLVVADPHRALQAIAAAWRKLFRGPVLGVTGSVGKTSTKDLLGSLLGPTAFITEANLNNLLGVPLMLLRLRPATHSAGVIEVGMSVPGELGVSAQILQPDLAIITAVASVHLEGVGSLAGIAREKATLLAALAPGGRAILPAPLLAWPDFAVHAERCLAVRFAGEPAPAVIPQQLIEASLGEAAGRRTLTLAGECYALGAVSDGLARNTALAVVAAQAVGISVAQIRATLAHCAPPVGRGSVHVLGPQTFYLDCYNSSPTSLLDAAQCFDRLSRAESMPRFWLVGGMAELGPTASALHREAGAALPLRTGDTVVAFGGEAAALLAGLPSLSGPRILATSLDEVRTVLSAYRGYIFVKGSRSFALERALPAALTAQLSFH